MYLFITNFVLLLLSKFIFEFFFVCNQLKTYQAPIKDIDHAGLIEFIDNLPDEDDPSIFGMNIYAQKILKASQADHLINSILSMEPLSAGVSRSE